MATVMAESERAPQISHEWELPGWIPDKPAGCDYGFVVKDQAISCSREELISKVAERGVPEIKFVWTPETPHPILPEKVPLLVTAFKQRAVKEARKAIYWGAGFLAFGIVLSLALTSWEMLYRSFLTVLGAVALIGGVWELHSTKHYTQRDAESVASRARFAEWIKSKQITVYTLGVAACIVVVMVAQQISGEKQSIEAAGLVKPAVWQGQVWRLFTGTLMHVNLMHFWMNFFALLQFTRIIEYTINRAYIPIVFLVSATCGSVFSLLLYPNTTSVGASGGLMGLLGFMTIAAYVDKEKYPPKFLRHLLEGIGFVALLGVVGFAVIDNAAHLGGLCGGLLLGWIFLRRGKAKAVRVSGAGLWLPAILSLALIGFIAFISVRQMFK